MLRNALQRVASDFQEASDTQFSANPLAAFIRRDLPKQASEALKSDFDDLMITGSPGQGNWASVPWLGFFDPLVTKSAMVGHYVVYLFSADMKELHLSLNQGTTAVYHEFGVRFGREMLRDRAELIRNRLNDLSKRFPKKEISLASEASLALGYEAGHAFGCSYDAKALPSEEILLDDLVSILRAYRTLTFRGGVLPSDALLVTAGTKELEEARRYQVAKRLERNRKVRSEVLKRRKPVCEACGLDPALHYGLAEKVKPENMPVDVHHLVPISEIKEAEQLRYRIPEDFAVLCPSCHRVAHVLEDPGDIAALRKIVRFKHITELF
jgi:hypothetical protein